MVKKKILSLVSMAVLLISTLFISGCLPQEAPAGEDQQASSPWTMVIFIVIIFAAMYFLMIRPQRKKQKEQQQMTSELKRGDRIVTAGGIYGTIESLSEDNVIIKVESGATMRVARNSVALKREK